MPKIGIIHQDYLNSPTLKERVSFDAYIYLPRFWPLESVDVFGCFRFVPRQLFAEAFEDDDYWGERVSEADVRQWFDEYEKAEILELWSDNRRRYGFWRGWFKYNRHRPDYTRKTPVPPSFIGSELHLAELATQGGKRRRSKKKNGSVEPSELVLPFVSLFVPSSGAQSPEDPFSTSGNGSDPSILLAARKTLPPREREEELLADMTALVQRITGEPWQATRPNVRHVRDLFERDLDEVEILGSFGCYAGEMKDPSKISIEKFAERFSAFHAKYHRLKER